jgi:p24 family protein alpha
MVTVDELFDHDHRVVNTRGSSDGRFTFSAADSGDHRICFTPSHVTACGWLRSGQAVGGVKLTLDLATGETSQIESSDKSKISDIVQKVRDLNARLLDIRREQVFQRVSSPLGRRKERRLYHT